jgi:hypothetical protein
VLAAGEDLFNAQVQTTAPLLVKAAICCAQKADPDLVSKTVRQLMPAIAEGLGPVYQEHLASGGGSFQAFLTDQAHRSKVTRILVQVADDQAPNFDGVVGGAYKILRDSGNAESVIAQAVSGLGEIVDDVVSQRERR